MGIREMIMTYIEENREMYEPFIEACQDKGETFEDYIKELRKVNFKLSCIHISCIGIEIGGHVGW